MGWLEGKTALVTGGGSGIGRAVVARFIEEGARVGVLERFQERVDEVNSTFGGSVRAVQGDVTNYGDNESAVAETVRAFGQHEPHEPPRLHRVKALERRRRAAEHTHGSGALRAQERHVAGVVAHAFFLLERSVLLLVHAQQLQVDQFKYYIGLVAGSSEPVCLLSLPEGMDDPPRTIDLTAELVFYGEHGVAWEGTARFEKLPWPPRNVSIMDATLLRAVQVQPRESSPAGPD